MYKKILLSLLIGLFFTGKVIAQSVDYYLPYPGILPDHPLYWLKMVRDRVGLVLTMSEATKAEKLLLYADKRLGAAWALIEGNKAALGVSTLTKAEKYLEQAVAMPGEADLKPRLSKALLKHQEVIGRLKAGAGANYAPLLDEMLIKLQLLIGETGAVSVQEVEASVAFSSQKVVGAQVEAATAYDALEKLAQENNWALAVKDYDFGKLVESINGIASGKDMTWIVYINKAAADKASDKFELKAGDKVEWRYEKVKP